MPRLNLTWRMQALSSIQRRVVGCLPRLLIGLDLAKGMFSVPREKIEALRSAVNHIRVTWG